MRAVNASQPPPSLSPSSAGSRHRGRLRTNSPCIVIGFEIAGICVIRWSLSRFSYRILVRSDGLEVCDASSCRRIGWEDIETVDAFRDVLPPSLRWLVRNPDSWSRTRLFVLRGRTGELLSFDANTVHDHVTLGTMIKEATDRRDVSWNIIEEYGD